MTKRAIVIILLLLLTVTGTQAQTIVEPVGGNVNPSANISWPPPVYTLRAEFTVRGTANMANMTSYFLEYRPLNPDLTPADASVPWIPAILPAARTVVDDVLGVWNTTVVPDGLYELRLTINISGGQPQFARVSPLRIENNPPPFAVTPTPLVVPTLVPQFATQAPQALPTLFPTPTALNLTPQAEAVTNANVRSGDSTAYRVIGSLFAGEQVPVVGRSSTGSGWWVIQMSNGGRGWVAPSVVRVTGDTHSLPLINPPVTPTPVATATPQLPDLTITGVRFDREIKQGENFQVFVTVRNLTGVAAPQFSVACNFTPQDKFYSTFVDGLAGFGQIDVALVVKLDSGGGHNTTANCAVDVNQLVAEVNDGNNFFNLTQKLKKP